MTDSDLRECASRIRRRGEKLGTLPIEVWEMVLSAEAILDHRPAMMNRLQVERGLTRFGHSWEMRDHCRRPQRRK